MFRFAKGAGQRVQWRLVREFDLHHKPTTGSAAAFLRSHIFPSPHFLTAQSAGIAVRAEFAHVRKRLDFLSSCTAPPALRSVISGAVLVNARRHCYQILGHAVMQFAR